MAWLGTAKRRIRPVALRGHDDDQLVGRHAELTRRRLEGNLDDCIRRLFLRLSSNAARGCREQGERREKRSHELLSLRQRFTGHDRGIRCWRWERRQRIRGGNGAHLRAAPARGGCVERVGRHLAHAGPPIHAHGCHAGLLAVGSQRRVAMRGLDVDDMHSTSR